MFDIIQRDIVYGLPLGAALTEQKGKKKLVWTCVGVFLLVCCCYYLHGFLF